MSKRKNKPKKSGGATAKKRTVAVLSGSGQGYVTEYVHRWTKKLMRAKDYGYKAWPFGCGK